MSGKTEATYKNKNNDAIVDKAMGRFRKHTR